MRQKSWNEFVAHEGLYILLRYFLFLQHNFDLWSFYISECLVSILLPTALKLKYHDVAEMSMKYCFTWLNGHFYFHLVISTNEYLVLPFDSNSYSILLDSLINKSIIRDKVANRIRNTWLYNLKLFSLSKGFLLFQMNAFSSVQRWK